MILDLASHHAEGVVARVVVDVDPAEPSGAAGRDPLLIGVVVHHDSGSRLADTLFTGGTGDTQREGENHHTSFTFAVYKKNLHQHTYLHAHIFHFVQLMCVTTSVMWAAAQAGVTDCGEGNGQLFIARLLLKLPIPKNDGGEILMSVRHRNTDNLNTRRGKRPKREGKKERSRRSDDRGGRFTSTQTPFQMRLISRS